MCNWRASCVDSNPKKKSGVGYFSIEHDVSSIPPNLVRGLGLGHFGALLCYALFSVALLAGSARSLSIKSFMVLPLPPSKTNTSNKAWGDTVRWVRMRQVWYVSYPGMRASP